MYGISGRSKGPYWAGLSWRLKGGWALDEIEQSIQNGRSAQEWSCYLPFCLESKSFLIMDMSRNEDEQ